MRRRERFVGRIAQLAQLDATRTAATHAAQLVTIYGPAGVGKSTLARRFSDDVRKLGGIFCWLSSDDTGPNALDILQNLASQGPKGFAELGRGDVPDVLVLDAFERFLPLTRWFFETQLSLAGARIFIILTTRERLEPRHRTELALQLDMSEIAMGNLSPEEATTALTQAHVPAVLHPNICLSSGGHPLLLALFADRYANSAATSVDPGDASDVLGVLVREILREAPTPEHRKALYALSLGASLDADLLGAITEDGSSSEIFDWLTRRSFTSPVPNGIAPHTLVREALFSDLVLTHPTVHATLADRTLDELERRVIAAPLERKLQLIQQMFAVRRDMAFVRDALGLERMSQCHLRPGTAADVDIVAEWIASFQGPDAAEVFRHWYAVQPDGFFVIADEELNPAGVFFMLRVGRTTAEQRARDPIVDDAWNVLRARNRESGRDDEMGCGRWFFARDTYQTLGVPDFTAVMLCGPIILTLDPRPNRFVAFYMTEPERWVGLDRAFGLDTLAHTVDFGDVNYSVRVRDVDPAAQLGESTAAQRQTQALRGVLQSFGIARPPLPAAPQPAAAQEIAEYDALDESEFHKAVRAALPIMHHRHELKHNPLVMSAMLGARRPVERASAADALTQLLVETCAALGQRPTLEATSRLLDVTFVRPVAKQQAAAAELGLPYGTYRYQLRAAIDLLAAELWERERSARARDQ